MTLREPTSVTLLERDGELDSLARALDAAAGGSGAMLSILGPAGIGKSSLLSEVRRRAADRGFQTLGAVASRLERGFPFGVCRQLLEPVVRDADKAERGGLLDGASAIGATLVRSSPSRAGRADEPLPSSPYDHGASDDFRSLHGLYWLTATLADSAPVLITVDDTHWADWMSICFLDFLARRIEGLTVTSVVAGREAEPDAPAELFDSVLVEPAVHVLRPAPLSDEATATLIEKRFDVQPAGEFAAACCHATGGNPFYLSELLGSLDESGLGPDRAGQARVGDIAPPAIARSVLGRVTRLGPPAVALVRALAVLGGRAELSTVAELAQLSDGEAADIADGLDRAAVLTTGTTLQFAHPITQAVVHDDIPTRERADAHRRAADLLIAQRAGRFDIATHLLHTRPAGDPGTRRRLRAAASSALGEGATDAAEGFLRRALAESPLPAERFELTATLGRTLAAQGRPEGIELMREASREAPGPVARAWIALPLGSALIYAGLADEAVTDLQDALSTLPAARAATRDQLEAVLTVIGITDLHARRRLRDRIARSLSAFRARPETVSQAVLSPLAIELIFSGHPAADAADAARRALAGDALISGDYMSSPLAYVAAHALVATGHARAAEQVLDTAADRAAHEGSGREMAVISATRSLARLHQGDLRGAQADAEQCLRLSGTQRPPRVFVPVALSTLATAHLERGETAEARAVLSDPIAQDLRPDGVLTQPLVEARARTYLETGDHEAALAELESCRIWAAAWGEASGSWPVQWRAMMARAAYRVGDARPARDLAREDLALARRFAAKRPVGRALLALGLVTGGEQGLAHLRMAVDTLTASEDRLEHARALVELGAARRRQGGRAAARPELTSGMAMARECGATALAERAYEELRATGARPPKIVATGLDALTPSELRVVRLAAAHTTNKQIAQSLFVTQKTVEVHLSHAYQKLGICRRADLPAALGRGASGTTTPARRSTDS